MSLRTVYCFVRHLPPSGTQWHSLYAATREAIAAVNGFPLEETAFEVDESLIDPSGRYFGPVNCDHHFHPPRIVSSDIS